LVILLVLLQPLLGLPVLLLLLPQPLLRLLFGL
jgi:hypothetical protein